MKDTLAYDGWLKVIRRETNERMYEILVVPPGVAGWVTDRLGKILLVQQYRPAMERLTWEIPAGLLDKPGLTPEETLGEELMEEAGLLTDPAGFRLLASYVPQMGHNFAGTSIYYCPFSEEGTDGPVNDRDVTHRRWVLPEQLEEWILEGSLEDEKTIMGFYAWCRMVERMKQK